MFVNDIFKKKQLDEGGPFSYGAKKPRKGSVADLAAQKRKEQEKGKQPVEPKDHMVGVARVKKDVAENADITKFTDYDVWLDKVDALGAQKHMQKNGTLIVAQTWDGDAVGEFDTRSNQGHLKNQGVAEGVTSPEIKQAYNAIMKTAPKSPERKRAIKHYQQLRADALDKKKEQGVAEGSAQDRLHKRHQELRKKSGLPDPDYYKELKTTYDLPDEERHAKQKEIKQKYKVTNEDREQYIEELQRAGYEIVNEKRMTCPECGGAAFSDRMLAEKQDACYHKVKSRYKVWPSAYASGALVRCRKKGAKNWGNKSKK